MKIFAFFFILLVSFLSKAQTFDCVKEFEWLKNTFETNDAGFQQTIDRKGKDAYQLHNQLLEKRISDSTSAPDCEANLRDWLHFFRKGHIRIRYLGKATEQEDVKVEYKSPGSVDVDIDDYLASRKTAINEGFLDIWTDATYRIGVKKKGDKYYGFIISSKNKNYQPKDIKFVINSDSSVTYYMGDKSPIALSKAEVVGNNYLIMEYIDFKRENPKQETPITTTLHFRALERKDPFIERVNESTMYLNIPFFYPSEKAKIDSVLQKNESILKSSPNLIIDIRNNGGGADRSYKELLPYLYTHPIRSVSVEWLSTKTSQKLIKEYSETIPNDKAIYENALKRMIGNEGKFIRLNDEPFSIYKQAEIFQNPQNIIILINRFTGSTSEQFVLAAKQSTKVKLLGRPTGGAIDISNLNLQTSPSGLFELLYGQSRSLRYPLMRIDDSGIQPDYFMDSTLPEYKWIDHAVTLLSQ
ncbi:S41 family peptidase [Glaciecola petra]|uniref:S41 family peptidase n=1 Tax=Glaciecola petra TaxID=3075602 RepID=A0ABU2ZUP1_9ALTE|nr:S41 family peptidase [Aestuariibacter sp. P117]MDT0596356.1 S41 family peptidase [Aestuariibacter sp. P117]